MMIMYLDVAISERMVGEEDFHNAHFVIISSNVKISMTHWRKYLEKNWEKVTELLSRLGKNSRFFLQTSLKTKI